MLKLPPAVAKLAPDGNLTPRQRRRLLIEMSLRKQKPGTGSSHTFTLERTVMIQENKRNNLFDKENNSVI